MATELEATLRFSAAVDAKEKAALKKSLVLATILGTLRAAIDVTERRETVMVDGAYPHRPIPCWIIDQLKQLVVDHDASTAEVDAAIDEMRAAAQEQ